MIIFKTTSYKQKTLLENASSILGAPVINNSVHYSGALCGKGFVKCFDLPSGIGISITKSIKSGWAISFHCYVPTEDVYVLRILFFEKKGVRVVLDDVETKFNSPGGRVQLLSPSSIQCVNIPAYKGEGYGVNIVLPAQWIKSILGEDLVGSMFGKYFALKDETIGFEQLDPIYDQYVNDMIDLDSTSPVFLLKVESLIINIVERFFTRLYERLIKSLNTRGLSSTDIEFLIKAEKKLIEDLSNPPSIESLATLCCMSETSFTVKFKQMFNNTVFAHFQNERLKKAYLMLSERKYSTKEIALVLGYQKTSSFIDAFKKKYNTSPRTLRLRNKLAIEL